MSKNCKDIIIDYLKANGYDGLYCPEDCDCACLIDDLIPCGSDASECEPGYKHESEECDWVIMAHKKGVIDE